MAEWLGRWTCDPLTGFVLSCPEYNSLPVPCKYQVIIHCTQINGVNKNNKFYKIILWVWKEYKVIKVHLM